MTGIRDLPLLEETYRLEAVLGEGGFGVVRRAVPVAGGPEVAVKLDTTGAPGAEDRVRREASLARNLEHPALVRFLGLFASEDGGLALVYELVAGTSLRERMRRKVASGEAMGWIRQLAEGLDALHATGLVHRDVKPGNVMITPGDRARLLDYGLLRGTASGATVTAEGLLLGTPAYMAPELIRGEPASPASDRWALAALAAELLQGRPVFPGRPEDILRDQLDDPEGGLRSGLSGLPPGLAGVFRKGLSPSPEARPGSATELAGMLEAALGAAPAAPTRELPGRGALASDGIEPPSTRGRRSRTSRAVWIGAGLLVVALLALSSPDRPRPAPPPPAPTPEAPLTRLVRSLSREIDELRGQELDGDGQLYTPSGGPATERSYPALSPDPLRWHHLMEHLPSYDRLLLTVRRELGGAGTGAAPEEIATLRKLDATFRELGMLPPFAPWLDLDRAEPPLPWDPAMTTLAEQLGAGEGPREHRGAAAGLVRAIEAAWKVREARNQELLALPSGELPDGFEPMPVVAAFFATPVGFYNFVHRSFALEKNRIAITRWFSEGHTHVRRALLLLRPALEAPDRHPALVRHVRRRFRGQMRVFLPHVMNMVGFEHAVGGEPASGDAALIHATLATEWDKQSRDLGLPRKPERIFRLLRQALEAPGDSAGDHWRVIRAATQIFDALQDLGRSGEYAGWFRELWPRVEAAPPLGKASLFLSMARFPCNRRSRLGLSPEELLRLASVVITPETFPEDTRRLREDVSERTRLADQLQRMAKAARER